ncbi:PEP-CTERM putative exosortase interaction domain-containing protein [Opitutaceae bacterium TAV1]|nr:PEP-CTERM putative exosortase interaction domain-containing protein [Opitutaceae bacterium TAV1]
MNTSPVSSPRVSVRRCYPAFARRLVGGAFVLLTTGLAASLSFADTPGFVINSGDTKTLADLAASGINNANDLHFRGDPAMHDTSPATFDLSNLTSDFNFPGHITIGDYPGVGDIPPSVNTSWTQSHAGRLMIAEGKTFQTSTLFIGAGSRFTSTGGGTLKLAELRIFDGATVTLTNLQISSANTPITNYGGDLTLRYTTDMTIRPMSQDFPLVSTTGGGPPPVNPSKTTMDVDANVTVTLPSYGVIRGTARDTFVKTGAGTLVLNGPYVGSEFAGTYAIDNGIVQIAATNNSRNTLGNVLSRIKFRGDATAPDSAAPRIAIKDSDVTFGGSGISNSNRLVIGTWDAAAHTPAWTAAASGGFTIAEGKTLTLYTADGGTPEQGGAIAVGDGSRFVADGGGNLVFDTNSARDGGALYAGSGSTVTLTNAIFTNNTAASGSGGAIYNDRAHITLNYTQDATLTGNTAWRTNGGGFVYLNSDAATSARLTLNVANGKQLTLGDAAFASRDTIDVSTEGTAIINKTGGGTVLVNSSIEFLEGTLNIDEGTLLVRDLVTAPTRHLAINLASGATLGGASIYPNTHGTGASAVAARGSRLQVGFAGDTAPARLMFDTLDLTAGGVVFDIDLFGTTPDSADRISANRIQFDPFNAAAPHLVNLGGLFAEGTWTILEATTLQGAIWTGNINELFTTQPLGRYLATFSLDTTGTGAFGKKVLLTLTADPAAATTLTWTGAAGNRWENSTLANWTGQSAGGQPANHFVTGDRVLFDGSDTAGQRSIVVEEPQVTVSDLLVEGSANYTFTGGGIVAEAHAANPAIAGAAGKLVKSGTGTLTLTNGYSPTHQTTSNAFTGGIDLHGGTIAIGRAEHLGSNLRDLHFLGDTATDATNPARLAILNPDPGRQHLVEFVNPGSPEGGASQRLVIGDDTRPRAGGITLAEKTILRISGNHITDRQGSGPSIDIDGTVLHVTAGSKFTVEGGALFLIEANKTSKGKGGAIYAGPGAVLDLANTRFTANVATQGGAIYNDAADITLRYAPAETGFLIADLNTSAASSANGGFLYMNGSTANGTAKTTFDITAGGIIIGTSGTATDSIASRKEPDAHDYNTLVKKGAGTLVINSNAADYHGHTAHEAGTLEINGVLGSSLHTLDIASGALLKGRGTVNGGITLHAGATIAPGNSPGTLTFQNLTLEGGSILQFEAGDKIVITGDLTFANISAGNQIVLNLSGYDLGTNSGFLDLMTFDTNSVAFTGSTLTDVSSAFRVTGLADGLTASFDIVNGQGIHLTLAATSVPEPVTTVLFLGGMAAGAAFALRRKAIRKRQT